MFIMGLNFQFTGWSLWILHDIATPNPNMIANIDEPPYESMGNGEPTIGSKPNTIPTFTTTYKKNAEANP